MKTKHILFLLEYFWPQVGGVESLFLELTSELVRRGHKCTVLTTRISDTPLVQEHKGVLIYRVGRSEQTSRYSFTLLAVPNALKLARQADVIHTTTYNAAFAAWLASKVTGTPAIITVHEVLGAAWNALPDTNWLHATTFKVLEALTTSLPFDEHVAVSRATRNALRQTGVPDARLAMIYNGHDTSDWHALPDLLPELRSKLNPQQRPLVAYYGRPGVTKGVEVLIDAFPILQRRTPEARLLLILGGYPEKRRERLVRRAKELLGDSVTILDSVPRQQLASYLSICDCIAVPSLTEGFGFTTVEAASLGCTVVASDVGSIPEVISGRYLLVPPNDPYALGDALCTALAGGGVSVPIKKFDVKDMVDGYEALYARLAENKPTLSSSLA